MIGQPQNLHVEKDIATFKIVTGPASNSAPKGLDLFKPVTYLVQCSQRQLNRGRAGTEDHSELIIEGYLEPRLGPDGKLFIAVVGLSVASKQQQNERKLTQLRDEVTKAEEIYALVGYGKLAPKPAPTPAWIPRRRKPPSQISSGSKATCSNS